MMKGYYIHFEGRASIGISKKLDMQLAEFGKHFDISEIEVKTIPRNLGRRILGLFPTASIARDYAGAFDKLDNPDFIYVRRTTCDRAYLNFWKTIREKYPDCKIIIEIFTYPYDRDDFGKWNAWPFAIKEWIYRRKLKKYIDRFVTYSDDESIFGIPTIRTANGIDIDSVQQVTGQYHSNSVRLLGVAYMQKQHGYERVIEGMYNYFKKSGKEFDIQLDLVGDGPEKEYYQKLVTTYNLQDKVTFYPIMKGQELEDMYVNADIAIIAFGMYKNGIYGKISALKSRECLAKGMPLASGCEIDVIDDAYPYAYIAPNNSTPVDMQELIDFYIRVCNLGNKQTNAETIRRFATEHVSMSQVLGPIVEYIENGK